ncbi:1315_t:CDS:2 [Entrophospora sp. SA101]|nr:1315_t:CDS:2 [Entrophospora sp. SA101]
MFNDFSHRVSLTTDAWTSTTTNQGYLGITAHWIDDSWRMKKILLNFIPLNESHTGVYLANKILDTLEEFSLCKKVLAMTTDNGWEQNTSTNLSNEEEWNDIKNTYNLLEPIFLATELLPGSSYPTLGDL